jgi:flagellar hook assembly protein FlgD
LYGSSGTARGTAQVSLVFDLVPPNVIPPGSTEIPIDFAVSGGHVEMKLYDIAGRFITDLVDDEYQAGLHTLLWNGQTENGQLVGSGVYLITLSTQETNTWKKIIIVR